MIEPDKEFSRVADEVIKITTWKNIRRYLALGGLGWVFIDLVITLVVILVIADVTRDHDLARDKISCQERHALVAVVTSQVEDASRDTENLKELGSTLGVTPHKFNALIREAEARYKRYLTALSFLNTKDCQDLK